MKIKGFNDKEQKLYDKLSDGEERNIRELKALFVKDAKAHCAEVYAAGSWDESTVDAQAQSYVRNSIRRLLRDGWADGPHTNDKLGRGTYQLSKAGKDKVRRGVDTTVSVRTPKTPKPKKEKVAKVAKPKKDKVAKAKPEKVVKVAKPKRVVKVVEVKKERAAKPKKAKAANGNGAVDKAKAAKAKAAASVAKEKADAAVAKIVETLPPVPSPVAEE